MKIKVIHPEDTILKYNKFVESHNLSRNMSKFGIFNEFKTYEPELLALASILKKSGNIVEYIDENLGDIVDFNEESDLVIIGGVTCQSERMYEISQKFMERYVKTVLAGQHVSINQEEAIRKADMVLVGSPSMGGEVILENLSGGGIVKTECFKEFITDFSLLENKKVDIFPLVASRGCNRGCLFCTVNSGSRDNFMRKPEELEIEIKNLKKYRSNPSIIFMDDNFFGSMEWLNKILATLKKLNIRYATHGDISGGKNVEFVKKLRESGCCRVFLGLESLEEKVLEKYAPIKKIWLENYEEYILNFQKNGIGTLLSFIVGFDEENNIIGKISNFINRVNPSAISISLLTPMPGTTLFERYNSAGRIVEKKFSRYTQNYPVIDFQGREDYLINGIKKIYNEFYLPENIKKRVNNLKEKII